jgi:NitT/TauT family transport system substrate-binding protein
MKKSLFTIVSAAAIVVAGAAHSADKVTLQLKWVTQAQFAGYFAAVDQGYFKAAGLDVQIIPGGPDINPMQVVAQGGAERS